MGRPLVFAVNGERVELPVVDPRTTVLQYLRSQSGLQGTKLGCGEGGCGACTVLLSKYDSSTKRVDEVTINSCLAPLCSIDGCSITTTEGLKSGKEYHAVHDRLSGFHGSQCGFCTPGFAMSIYGSLRKAAAAVEGPDHENSNCMQSNHGNGEAENAGIRLPLSKAERCIAGNICRCTGYRPILDTCKSFSNEVDVEDLGINAFWSSKKLADASLLPPYDPSKDPKFPSFLKTELEQRENSEHTGLSFKFIDKGLAPEERAWKTARSMTEVFEILKQNESSTAEIKLVVGNTSAGVYKDMKPHLYVDISGVPELQSVKVTEEGGVEVGAGVSLSQALGILLKESESKFDVVYAELAKHIGQIASEQVRNRGSLGGNIILAQQRGFDSDLATILVGAGAEVTVAGLHQQQTAPLEEFLSWGRLEPGTILVSIRIPRWKHVASGEVRFKTYRVSARRNGNAVSYINAAFLAVVNRTGQSETPSLKEVRLAFGAFGAPHAVRAEKVEKLLIGKSISPGRLLEAIKELRKEIKAPASLHKAEYRGNVAVAFFFDFFKPFLEGGALPLPGKNQNGVYEDGSSHNGDVSALPLPGKSQKGISENGSSQKGDVSALPLPGKDHNGISENGSSLNGNGSVEHHDNSTAGENGTAAKKESTGGGNQNGELWTENGAATETAEEKGGQPALPNADFSNIAVVEFGSNKRKESTLRRKSKRFTPEFSATQKFATSKEFWPVGEPSQKVGVHLQAAGEAVYVDDIPPVEGTVYATYLLSDKPAGKILDIDISEARKSPGFVDLVTYKDIPGSNVGHVLLVWQGPMFAEDYCHGINDPLALVIGDSYEHAREAAAKVKLHVQEDEEQIYTVEEAAAKGRFVDLGIFGFAENQSFGDDPVKSDHRIENAEIRSGSQYHFYMETQSAYAIPDEDGCMTVYSSNQMPNGLQKTIAGALGVSMNSIRVITRRLGGGFGGKASRANDVATVAAVAAHKLRRPVKIFLDRQTDMRMCGGRHEMKATYSVDFDSDGKINGLQLNTLLDAGSGLDAHPLILLGLNGSISQYDWGSLRTNCKICKTNKPSRGIMRGPGDIQSHFIAESVIEHVAAYLGMDPIKVRERNMHSVESLSKFYPTSGPNTPDSYTVPFLWQKLKTTSHFEERELAVKEFNAKSKWVKKGIDIVSGLYHVSVFGREAKVGIFEDGSVVVEVSGIEMGQGLWTKVRQAVVHGLMKLWGSERHPAEKVDISQIRVIQNDTLSLPNSEVTGGSTGSEGSCQAALLCCETLVQNLAPFVAKLREGGATPVLWEVVIAVAKQGNAVLTSHRRYDSPAPSYVNFGVCVSEVSVDVLTGSTTILQTDLLYDCGKSLNPAVDIGQVEGAFMMGVGFYLTEEYRDEKGRILTDSTWDYKPPTIDNIPLKFHVELSNTKPTAERILSSKASGEPPILLAKSVHSAVKQAIFAAREDHQSSSLEMQKKARSYFRLDNLASMDKVQALCGSNLVEQYLASLV